ncbi:MAG TPA: serine hydrolase domain-containing protein [Steroidobacteraceae bacterium]|jgi:CubicO group peptidase (beta-lactamase class C family)|nr:serine hydrolase domain-containing protein [Steroidobacteraceae bacterium]
MVGARLRLLGETIEDDIGRGRYHGGVIIVARHGQIGFHEAFGHGYPQRRRPMTRDAVFNIFSLTKAFTNTLVFRAVEQGQFALTTKVSAVIPEFSDGLRADLTVYHLLTHTTGIGPIFNPYPDSRLDRLADMVKAVCEVARAGEYPGVKVNYSPMVSHVLLGEMARRTDRRRRPFRQIAAEDIFAPLGMVDTAIGLRADLKERKLVPDFLPTRAPMQHLSNNVAGQNGAFEDEQAEMPWVGAVSTAADLHRFAEMLRQGGQLDGVRIVSRAMLERATQNHTGDKPNELYKVHALARGWEPGPAYIGLGFSLRGEKIFQHQFGTLTSPRTFGNYGAGSMLLWVDPEIDMTFVALSAGVMHECDNIERFQRLSDIAVSAAI